MRSFIHCGVITKLSRVNLETPGANCYFMSGPEVAHQIDEIADHPEEVVKLNLPKAFNFNLNQVYPIGLAFIPYGLPGLV